MKIDIDSPKPQMFYCRGQWNCIGQGLWFRRDGVNEAIIAWKQEVALRELTRIDGTLKERGIGHD